MATFIQYKTAKGEKRYRFKVYLGLDPVTGKRIETSRQGFRTKKEAQAAMTKVQLEYQSGKRKEKAQNQTVNDVYQQWFESWKPTVRDSTAYVVQKNYAKHFKKEIGSYRIQKVKAQIIQKLVNQLSEQYKSYRTILKPLKMTFDYAYRMDIVETTPFSKVIYPKGVDKQSSKPISNYYTKSELIEFLDEVKHHVNFNSYARFYLLAYTGMRGGELMALSWQDINFKDRTIHIHRTLSRSSSDQTYIITNTKTQSSDRIISISQGCIDVLRKLGIKHSGLIFHGKDGRPLQREVISASLKRFYRNHPQFKKITPHGFRHTHASLLLEAGANIKQVQQRLGHADIQTTLNIYTHLSKESAVNTAEIFDRFLN